MGPRVIVSRRGTLAIHHSEAWLHGCDGRPVSLRVWWWILVLARSNGKVTDMV